ncbi:LysR family transcriptional regulator [Reinekea forsetii]|nr:LysR family transcriptional regulator [Reinekea forsetii]
MNHLPLQGLFYFYTAAEAGSFKLAAERLFITPAAMSQQIRILEDKLDVKLFERNHRQVSLTEAGRQLLPYVQTSFNAIQDGLNQLGQDPDPSKLAISTLPSFAQQWLVPRLGKFSKVAPDLSILTMPLDGLVDFRSEPIDLCIRFGLGNYQGLHSELLLRDRLYPVCHPLYLESHPIETLSDVAKYDLIEDARPDMNWHYWLELAGVSSSRVKPSLSYSGVHLVLEGALAVQGVALVRHSVAAKYIKQGLLVQLGDVEVESAFHYFLCAPEPYFKRDKVQRFVKWIKDEAEQFLEDHPMPEGNKLVYSEIKPTTSSC